MSSSFAHARIVGMEKIPHYVIMMTLLVLRLSVEVLGNADETCKCFKDGCSSYTFNVISPRVNWKKSRQLCQETKRGDLVLMESDAEWTFLKITALNLTKAEEYFIGLKKGVQSKEWRWLSNTSAMNISQKRWAQGQPSGDGNCVVMMREDYLGNYGKYNDLDCLAQFRSEYVCERPVDSCNKGKELTTRPPTMTKPATIQSSRSQSKGLTSTDNCLRHNLVQTTATSPKTIASTSTTQRTASPTQDFTRDPEGGKQTRDKDNCSSVVIILASLIALSVALLILGVCFLFWRKKQRKDVRNATAARDQLDNQERSSLSPENAARELGFSEEAEPCDTKRENQRRETHQSSSQEYGYAMLTRTMMLPGDSSYASLVKSKEGDCINDSSVAASPLL